jgi:solute carrier family 50 (sugar transporter)
MRDRSVGSLPLLPYSTMIVNGILWFSYGLLKSNPSVWSCNGLGLVLGIYYFVSYVKYSPTSSPILPGTVEQHIQVVGGFALMTVLLILSPIPEDPAPFIGRVGCIICVLLFGSPLVVLRQVIITKDARSIPLPFTIASTVNCFLWTVFGLWQMNDANIYIPNVLGLALCLTQVALKLYFPSDLDPGFGKEPHGIETRPLSVV